MGAGTGASVDMVGDGVAGVGTVGAGTGDMSSGSVVGLSVMTRIVGENVGSAVMIVGAPVTAAGQRPSCGGPKRVYLKNSGL